MFSVVKTLMLRRGEELVCWLAHIWNKLNSCAIVKSFASIFRPPSNE